MAALWLTIDTVCPDLAGAPTTLVAAQVRMGVYGDVKVAAQLFRAV